MDAIEIALREFEAWTAHIDIPDWHQQAAEVILVNARAELAALRAQAEAVGCGGDKSGTLRVVEQDWRER